MNLNGTLESSVKIRNESLMVTLSGAGGIVRLMMRPMEAILLLDPNDKKRQVNSAGDIRAIVHVNLAIEPMTLRHLHERAMRLTNPSPNGRVVRTDAGVMYDDRHHEVGEEEPGDD